MAVEKRIERMEMVGVNTGLAIRKGFQVIEKIGKSTFKIIFLGGIGLAFGIIIGLTGGIKK